MSKGMKRAVIILAVISACIYGMQLVLFHDPRDTFFYIFQDFAFLPLTIAIATIVVGQVMDDREKEERIQKTRMLTSSFFTELGGKMMRMMMRNAEFEHSLHEVLVERHIAEDSIEDIKKCIDNTKIKVRLNEEFYNSLREMILERRTTLLVISSNPVLLDHEEFTDMLWGVFHLIDEFSLRGEYRDLKKSDIGHLEEDLSSVLKLLLKNWIPNVQYMKETYPNFYNEARSRMLILAEGIDEKRKA